jgi:hypothetical protein
MLHLLLSAVAPLVSIQLNCASSHSKPVTTPQLSYTGVIIPLAIGSCAPTSGTVVQHHYSSECSMGQRADHETCHYDHEHSGGGGGKSVVAVL